MQLIDRQKQKVLISVILFLDLDPVLTKINSGRKGFSSSYTSRSQPSSEGSQAGTSKQELRKYVSPPPMHSQLLYPANNHLPRHILLRVGWASLQTSRECPIVRPTGQSNLGNSPTQAPSSHVTSYIKLTIKTYQCKHHL